MKKFFETPVVSSAELFQEDVIMLSPGTGSIATDNTAEITIVKDTTSAEFKMWKGGVL